MVVVIIIISMMMICFGSSGSGGGSGGHGWSFISATVTAVGYAGGGGHGPWYNMVVREVCGVRSEGWSSKSFFDGGDGVVCPSIQSKRTEFVCPSFVRWLGLYLFLCSVDQSKRTEFVCPSSTRPLSAGSDCTYSYVQ